MAGKLHCPHCGSDQIVVSLNTDDVTVHTNRYGRNAKSGFFVPKDWDESTIHKGYKAIAVCQNCGHSWVTSRVDNEGCGCWGIVIGFFVISMVIGLIQDFVVNTWDTITLHGSAHWAVEYTPLDEFDYEVEDGAISLGKYRGESKFLNIAPTYTVDGEELPVTVLNKGVAFSHRWSIIIPEGVTEIDDLTFSSSHVRYLYLPATLQQFDDWSSIEKKDKCILYYGGSREELASLCSKEETDIADLHFAEIHYNVSISDLLAQ